MNNGKSYKYYIVYGDIKNVPLGLLDDSNVPKDADPLEFANKFLAKRDMEGKSLIEHECGDKDLNFGKEVSTTFLYKNQAYIDVENVAGMPSLIFHPDALTDMDKSEIEDSIGIGFADLETAERAMIGMIKIIQHFQAEKEKKVTNDGK